MNDNELKLWYSYKNNYEFDFWICTAKNVEDLKLRYEKEFNITMTLEEFENNYTYNIIDKIDGYKIKLKDINNNLKTKNIRGNQHKNIVTLVDESVLIKNVETGELLNREFFKNIFGKIYFYENDNIIFIKEDEMYKYEIMEE